MSCLYLNGNRLTDLDACLYMIDLSILFARGNQLTDISGLVNTTQLTDVDLGGNELTDISALSGNTGKLKQVRLADNRLTDISALTGCADLMMITFDNNRITDISALAGCRDLYYLSAGYNEITDITPLEQCMKLAYTDLGDNRITDITPLVGHSLGQQILLLQNNEITDISLLPVSTEYLYLSLYGNPVADLSVISEFEKIDSGRDKLYMTWQDGMDYSPVALSGYKYVFITDVPLNGRAPLKDEIVSLRREKGLQYQFWEDPAFITAEEADDDMAELREKAKAKEDNLQNQISIVSILS